MIDKTIAIIGAGNMGQAIAHGLLRQKIVNGKFLTLANPRTQKLKEFEKRGIRLEIDNRKAASSAEIIIFAVKPQVMESVLRQVKDVITSKKLIISVAAGIEIKTMQKYLGKMPVVRVMPNICATVGEATSCWVKSKEVGKGQVSQARMILQTIGKEFELAEEGLLDKITAISGSGPAYLFYLAEILENSAKRLGIRGGLAKSLVTQTVLGSAKMLKDSGKTAQELKESVASKGGITEAALKEFAKQDIEGKFFKGVKAASRRAKELRKTKLSQSIFSSNINTKSKKQKYSTEH